VLLVGAYFEFMDGSSITNPLPRLTVLRQYVLDLVSDSSIADSLLLVIALRQCVIWVHR
jgi:hypothetical protein